MDATGEPASPGHVHGFASSWPRCVDRGAGRHGPAFPWPGGNRGWKVRMEKYAKMLTSPMKMIQNVDVLKMFMVEWEKSGDVHQNHGNYGS